MAGQTKVLILDDDEEFLALYQKLLSQHVTTAVGVLTATTGHRALSLLESEQIGLMIVDLNLPRMDGLQVISIVRRKHPQTRLVVLTSLHDEQFRARAYALGVDQYWIKPETDHETGLFLEAMEALLRRDAAIGFRGVQNKSLADIVQLECLAQSTSVLRINHGAAEGRLWLVRGEVIDAETQDLSGEPAFQRIMSWPEGTFESLPGDETRPRTIFASIQGLLLNTAQAIDEAVSRPPDESREPSASGSVLADAPALADLGNYPGVECALVLDAETGATRDHWGIHDPRPLSDWSRKTLEEFRTLGESLHAGELRRVLASAPDRKLAISTVGKRDVCVGFQASCTLEGVRETLRTILTKWAS
jgi:DNA-binding response OmpR family regulator